VDTRVHGRSDGRSDFHWKSAQKNSLHRMNTWLLNCWTEKRIPATENSTDNFLFEIWLSVEKDKHIFWFQI
jgi:hypothetical protein